MPSLITVRWPLFARLEAASLFPTAVSLATNLAPVRMLVERTVAPEFAPLAFQLGVSWSAVIWLSFALVSVLPFLAWLLVADRLLTVRKGYALLSMLAIASVVHDRAAFLRLAVRAYAGPPRGFRDF